LAFLCRHPTHDGTSACGFRAGNHVPRPGDCGFRDGTGDSPDSSLRNHVKPKKPKYCRRKKNTKFRKRQKQGKLLNRGPVIGTVFSLAGPPDLRKFDHLTISTDSQTEHQIPACPDYRLRYDPKSTYKETAKRAHPQKPANRQKRFSSNNRCLNFPRRSWPAGPSEQNSNHNEHRNFRESL